MTESQQMPCPQQQNMTSQGQMDRQQMGYSLLKQQMYKRKLM